MPSRPTPRVAAGMCAGAGAPVLPSALLLSCLTMAAAVPAADLATVAGASPTASRSKAVTGTRPASRSGARGVRKTEPLEPELGPDLLAVAERVHQGTIACELGASVSVHADSQRPGHFDVHLKQQRFRMVPVATTTGAIRLEDAHAGAVWLQLANKSMLMSQKLGQRLADACITPQQRDAAQRLQGQPGILDAPPTTTPRAAAPAASAAM